MRALVFILLLGVSLPAEELDFLEKVNDKPKTNIPKLKEEESKSKQVSLPVASTTLPPGSKKKKEKKKKGEQEAISSLEKTTNFTEKIPADKVSDKPLSNLTPTIDKPVISVITPNAVEKPKPESRDLFIKKEEETQANLTGWLDSEKSLEPRDLPGFTTVSLPTRDENLKETKSTKQKESFWDIFDRYKKALIILGFIILFAFYRLRLAKPSGSSRSYRR